MLALQRQGCHNINFVTPTHVVPQILEALVLAREEGLHVPLVYNSSGYDSVDTLRLLEGIFDIYMPDAKYGSDEPALVYSNAPGYTGIMKSAIQEMHRQVGDLVMDEDGIASARPARPPPRPARGAQPEPPKSCASSLRRSPRTPT